MSILNYFIIGIFFTCFVDIMLWVCRDYPTVKKVYHTWGYNERFWCTLIWPVTSAYFLFAILRNAFK